MNGVFGCASDCGVNIYYQGTDNIHLNYGDVNNIVDRYKQKYDLDLVGQGLCNFHVDLDLDGPTSEVYGIEITFLGKHTNVDDDGNVLRGEHIRMKWIPNQCIKYYAEQNSISVLYIYKQLLDNESIEFDLTIQNNKHVFRNTQEYNVKLIILW